MEGIKLDCFDISTAQCGLSLSVSPRFYTSDDATMRLTCTKICELVEDGKLWFLSSGICHIQMVVQFNNHAVNVSQREGKILEIIAGSICQSDLWQMLGLSIELIEIRYDTERDDTPNLCFEIEQPDKSAALLAPLDVSTTTIEGISCLLNFHSTTTKTDHPTSESPYGRNASRSSHRREQKRRRVQSPNRVFTASNIANLPPVEALRQRRQQTVDLAVAALYKVLGIEKVLPGIQFSNEMIPSLLQLAPMVWNAHYMQTTAEHSKSFPVIASILSSIDKWQSPSLIQKVSELRGDDKHTLETSIQQKLWAVLLAELDIITGTRAAVRDSDGKMRKLVLKEFEAHLFSQDNEEPPDEDVYSHLQEEGQYSDRQGTLFTHDHHGDDNPYNDSHISEYPDPDLADDFSDRGTIYHNNSFITNEMEDILPPYGDNYYPHYENWSMCGEVNIENDYGGYAAFGYREDGNMQDIKSDGTLQALESEMTLYAEECDVYYTPEHQPYTSGSLIESDDGHTPVPVKETVASTKKMKTLKVFTGVVGGGSWRGQQYWDKFEVAPDTSRQTLQHDNGLSGEEKFPVFKNTERQRYRACKASRKLKQKCERGETANHPCMRCATSGSKYVAE